ncbi:MAG: magnesium/cobalt transporter CorA [Pirellulales bacterium]
MSKRFGNLAGIQHLAPSFRKRHPPAGSRPGTLVAGDSAHPSRVFLMRYHDGSLAECQVESVAEIRAEMARPGVVWIDVQGLGDERLLRELAELFQIHDLALEDVVNAPLRPKVELFDNHLLYVSRMARFKNHADWAVDTEQISLFYNERYVLTFQERHGDVLDPVRHRIRNPQWQARGRGSIYLAYAIIDAVIDGYFPVIERYADLLEELESDVVLDAQPELLGRINQIKRDLMAMRRFVLPQRDALNNLLRDGNRFLPEDLRPYFRDCFDHCIQAGDAVDNLREIAANLLNTYLSSIGNRTNDVMKILTIMASIFIPLTFVAGVYGMNFTDMPELHSRWGYPGVLAAMAAIGLGMLVYFYKLGWIGRRQPKERKQQADESQQ